jgi:hypothetical protein
VACPRLPTILHPAPCSKTKDVYTVACLITVTGSGTRTGREAAEAPPVGRAKDFEDQSMR